MIETGQGIGTEAMMSREMKTKMKRVGRAVTVEM